MYPNYPFYLTAIFSQLSLFSTQNTTYSVFSGDFYFDLTWSISSEDKDQNYTVAYGESAGLTNLTQMPVIKPDGKNVITETISDLSPGVLYDIHFVRSGVEVYNITKSTKPLAPVNVQVADAGTDYLHVTWDTNSVSRQDSYSVALTETSPPFQHSNNIPVNPVSETDNITDTSLNVTGLSPGHTYNIYVVAVSYGEVSNSSVTVTDNTVPLPPQIVAIKAVNTSSLSLTLTGGTDSQQDSFHVSYTYRELDVDKGETNATSCTQSSSSCLLQVPGHPGQDYNVQVIASKNRRVSRAAESTHSTKPAAVSVLKELDSNVSSVHVGWTLPNVSRYDSVIIEVMGGLEADMSFTFPVNTTDVVLANLSAGTEYNVSVYLKTLWEESESVSLQLYTYPLPPSDLRADSITESSMSVTWTAPGPNLAIYNVTITEEDEVIASYPSYGYEVLNFSNLVAGTPHEVTVKTVVGGKESSELTRVFYTKPYPPTNVSVSSASQTVKVVWEVPLVGRVDNYTVTLAQLGGSNESVTVTSNNHTFINVSAGRTYTVYISSQSGDMFSDVETAYTHTLLLSHTLVTINEVGSYIINVSWNEPAHIDFDSYELLIDPPDGKYPQMIIPSSLPRFYNFTGLTPGKEYTVSIRTYSDGRFGPWESQKAVTKPLTVTRLDAKGVNSHSLEVSWIAPSEGLQSHFVVSLHSYNRSINISEQTVMALENQSEYSTRMGDMALFPGERYRVSVTTVGQSVHLGNVYSNSVETTGVTMPKPVENVEGQIMGYDLVLSWEKPSGSLVDSYMMWYKKILQNINSSWVTNTPAATMGTLPLFPGEEYEIQVTAISYSVHSVPVTKTYSTAPLPPSQLEVLSDKATTQSVTVSFSFKTSDSYVESWEVLYMPGLLSPPLVVGREKLVGDQVEVIIPGLLPGVTYNISVRSMVKEWRSPYTLPVSATVKPVLQTELSEEVTTNDSISLAYTINVNDVYDHLKFRVVSDNLSVSKNKNDASRDVKFEGLDGGKLYTVEVVAISGDQMSDPQSITLQTLPNVPLVTINPSPDKVSLELYPPAGRVDRYVVVCSCEEQPRMVNNTSQAATLNFFVLKPHTKYTFNITAWAGDKSNMLSLSTWTSQSAPSEVTGLSIRETGPKTVQLGWMLPDHLNGFITGFNVHYMGSLTGSVTSAIDEDEIFVNGTEKVFDNLKAGYDYVFTVKAKTVSFGPAKSISLTLQTYKPAYKAGVDDTTAKALPVSSDVSHIRANFTDAFSDEFGPIIYYSIVVTTDPSSDKYSTGEKLPSWLDVQNDPNIHTYAAISKCPNLFESTSTCNGRFSLYKRQKRQALLLQYKVIELGSETNCDKKIYCNGPLRPETFYYVKLRAYTSDTDFTDTPFSAPIKTDSESGGGNGGVIAGAILGVLLGIALIVGMAIFLRMKLRERSTMYRQTPGHGLTPRSSMRQKKSHVILLGNFKDHVRLMAADSDFKYAEEYEDLKEVGKTQPCTAAELPVNRGKNRFINILPYDHSRVKLLSMDDDEGSDYINANYIPGFNSKREYIATQGPLPSTRDDLWRMVWEQDCRNIVMLTRCTEKGREKCDQYWPAGTDAVFYGDIQVAALNETRFPDWTITEFQVSMGDQTRQLRHFHFTAWPDFGVPEKPQTLLRFVRTVRNKLIPNAGPITVHCSAGVGRSGTFIVLDRLLQHITENDAVDIYGLVYELRKERVWMVQTEQQYICIHQCLVCVLDGREDELEHVYDNIGQHNPAFDDDEGINVEVP